MKQWLAHNVTINTEKGVGGRESGNGERQQENWKPCQTMPCDLDPPHNSTQTSRRVWEKRFPLKPEENNTFLIFLKIF